MDYKKLAEVLFPNINKDIEFFLKKYPKRNLSDTKEVSRYAPSPTGYMHIGNFFQMFISYNLTRVTDGVMFLRIEDTDLKREKKDAQSVIYEILDKYKISFDEFQTLDGVDIGDYGPYIQSQRIEIYQTFAKYLVSIGRAFPCFCKKTEGKEDVLKLREIKWQEDDEKEYDKCRDLSFDEILEHINNGDKFAIRFKTLNKGTERIKFYDLIKGEIDTKANAKDFIILKDDGIPPYAFAHVVDDTLMGTTIVVRGEEYISSTPSHIELFDAFNFKHIKYCHNPLICKIGENGNRRKISKRLDPEADMRYYFEKGYPINCVLEYLLNIINSGFEEWRLENPDKEWQDFKFGVNDITAVSPIFDLFKLADISKNIFAKMTAEEITNGLIDWAESYDIEFYNILIKNKKYAQDVIDIDRGNEKPRKDIFNYEMIKNYYDYMFMPVNEIGVDQNIDLSNDKLCLIMQDYAKIFNYTHNKDEWFNAVKQLAEKYQFAVNNKEFKANPKDYLGNLGQFCGIIRKLITGKDNTPDLYSICVVLGEKLKARINYICNILNV